MKLSRCLTYMALTLVAIGCTFEADDSGLVKPNPDPVEREDDADEGTNPDSPTVPLKRRPIVPSTKLPRPRYAQVFYTTAGTMAVSMAEDMGVATVTITEHDTEKVMVYVVDSEVFELEYMPECAFDIAVEVGGEVEVYTVMEE